MHTVLLVLSDSQKPAKRHITPLSVFSHLKPCLYLRGAAKAKNAPKNCGATGMQHAQTTLHAYNGERGHTAANTKGDQTRLRPARFTAGGCGPCLQFSQTLDAAVAAHRQCQHIADMPYKPPHKWKHSSWLVTALGPDLAFPQRCGWHLPETKTKTGTMYR
jgi:hypothetical protein